MFTGHKETLAELKRIIAASPFILCNLICRSAFHKCSVFRSIMMDGSLENNPRKGTFRKVARLQFSLYLWFLQVVIVLCLISIVIWQTLMPKSPVYMIRDVYVPGLAPGHSQNCSVILQIEISNPNKRMGIYFDDIHLTLCYSDAVIGVQSLPGFYQGFKQTTSSEVPVNADRQFWKGVSGRILGMEVGLKTTVRYKIFRSKTRHHQMDFEGYVPVGSDGRISGDKNIKLQHTLKQRIA